jgi:hypothetical protein
MRAFLTVMLILLLAALFASALAVNDDPQRPSDPPATPAAAVGPDIPENAAEREAAARGELQLEPVTGAPVLPAPSSPMMAEIQALLEETNAAVADLAGQVAAAASEEIARDLQLRAEQLKRDTELAILNIQLRYAHEAGQAELAAQIEETIARITNPPAPTAPAEPRPAPGNQR